ncbi:aminotransferase class III-fold pyridoxal phosphate-dependent enzyme [Roseomonas hellenica]|uniref:Aminotransferase class III-fold pyridoxal phosphate-dependent enzyme n=1 Tax=Plastoroseomonas hellenica TaxID=2687306 RepID=A0ABS5EZY7_9PROT|nr:aminotransferase class III-fold pyridoxal phosphate-dependent enzyme [Plastoroseomonas hellenica]MBR0665842.1 aminotransferase class III-fold pyridoxal phosphate-dependent enzyme [Plastoroseomonas hellenica]
MKTGVANAEELALVETAKRVMPAGGFGNIATDIIIREGRAGRVWDVSGNEYVDYLLGSGPMLVGHAHPEVNAAVMEQVGRGSTFFANNEHGIQLAAEIVEALPCADQVRFASTGTEADAYAMRLARAWRKRSKILKFEGGYHGMSDYGLMSLWPSRPGNSEAAISDSAGIPESVQGEMLVAPYNDLAAAEQLIHAHRDELAGVIVEPMQRLIPPVAGFLQGLRAITAEYGIPLIFDEVVTGFRLAYGGGQSYYGVTPDICTLGKVIGGGYPLSAVAGRAEIMAHFDQAKVGAAGFMPQIGTLSGNPIAAVAGLATLRILKRPGAYETIFATGRAIWAGLEKALKDAGQQALILGEPVMFDALFTARGSVTDYRGTLDVDKARSKRFNELVRERGVFKSDSKIYISLAHDARDVQDTVAAFTEAAGMLA